ncbi:diguanylate cyclase [Fischerella thermalis CCMEE 5201]|nr:diguanylate cyclase [Fischerella thermalis CCMEE 5201]
MHYKPIDRILFSQNGIILTVLILIFCTAIGVYKAKTEVSAFTSISSN